MPINIALFITLGINTNVQTKAENWLTTWEDNDWWQV